jgi:hypothetical protein
MAIVFGGDAGIVENSYYGFLSEISKKFDDLVNTLNQGLYSPDNWPPPAPILEKVHIDDGFENVPGTSYVGSTIDNVDDIKQRRISSQEPHATIYIKKRAFWGLADENDTRFMDKGEKLYLRATKILFEKKCNQLASYEALTKVSKLVSEDADLDAIRIEQIIDLLDEFIEDRLYNLEKDAATAISIDPNNISFNEQIITQLNDLKNNTTKISPIVDALREICQKQNKLKQAVNTNWVIDPDQLDIFNIGRGSGVIELTMFNNLSTSLGFDNIEGQVSFSIQDPYNLMKITTDDIEMSLSSAHSEIESMKNTDSSGNWVSLKGPQTILEQARNKEKILRDIRENRIAELLGTNKSIIGSSNISEIIFEISPTSYAQNKVVAYTTSLAKPSYNRDQLVLSMIDFPVEQQLTVEERELVGEIFKLLGEYSAAVEHLNNDLMELNSNEHVKHARRNLRLHYLGKSIIQAMDGLHIYIRGNTYKHGEVVGPLSHLLNGSAFIKNAANDPNATDAVLIEEMRQFGLDDLGLDVDFYRTIRTGSFMRNAGMHVFGGLVTSVNERYDAGSGVYITNVSGKSNARWLNLSRVNIKPSLSQPQGLLEDPLTAFSYKIDPATGLISEKPEPLPGNSAVMASEKESETSETANVARLRFKSGTNKCKLVSLNNWEQDYAKIESGLTPIWKHAPGMIYKWKPGTMVATIDANLDKSLQGSEDDNKALKRYVGLTVVENPFAGLDAADIISLLVTGYPHSAERFYKAANTVGTFKATGSNASPSFFHSFFDITRSTNKALGNFEPFREIVTDGMAFTKQLALRGTIQKSYSEIERLRKELAKAQDYLLSINRSIHDKETNRLSNDIDEQDRQRSQKAWETYRDNLVEQIDSEEEFIYKNLKSAKEQGIIRDVDDVVFNLASLSSGIETSAHAEQNKNVRLKNKFLQVRSQYACKFNEDKNLLIVSDEYDTNANIQAFVVGLQNQPFSLFNSEFKHPIEICRTVAETLNMEFYCDSQGHLRFRPQQYNKIPLSLILKMFMLNDRKGVQLYPDFLKQLFKSREITTREEIDIVDIEIRIKAYLLNLGSEYQDTDVLLSTVKSESASDQIVRGQYLTSSTNIDSKSISKEIIKLSNSLELKTGFKGKFQNEDQVELEVEKYNNPATPNVNSMRLKLANEIKMLLSRKQQLSDLKDKLDAQGKAYEINFADFSPASQDSLNELLAPFGNLIEDDYTDFLGPGSASRFIIYDDQIISFEFTEDEQNATCRADVTGQHNLVGSPGSLTKNMPNIWAGATDFDMWRQYGYRSLPTQNKPFLKDAQSQCAPYALFLLSRARKDILRGRITLYGNEYYQLGDVVYINAKDLLFYVNNVSHSFDYSSGNFTTTLDLRYGHPLGEYIPTPFDIIGESLIRNQKRFNKVIMSRETSSIDLGVHLGMVIFENEESDDEHKSMLSSRFARFNIRELKRSLLTAHNYIVSNDKDIFPKIEIRGWCLDEANIDKVQKRMDAVVTWFGQPVGRWLKFERDDRSRYIVIGNQYKKLENNQIYNHIVKNTQEEGKKPVEPVNLSKELEGEDLERFRIPSEEVYNALPEDDRDPTNIIEIVLMLE